MFYLVRKNDFCLFYYIMFIVTPFPAYLYDEIILYLVIADTYLQTLFKLSNITFGNELNC